MNKEDTQKIMVLEDKGLIRAGMKALIQIAEPTAHIYEASSYEQAITILSDGSIDIAFLDYELESDKNGLDVLRYIHDSESDTRFMDTRAIMLSGVEDKQLVFKCIEAGACGYIPKGMDDDGSTFRRALDTVFNGGVFLPTFVFGRGGRSPEPSSSSTTTIAAESLGIKGKQLEVLYYLCQGYPNKTIANRMGIEEGTVRKDYVTKLLRFFKVSRRTQLLVEVSRRGIIIPKPEKELG